MSEHRIASLPTAALSDAQTGLTTMHPAIRNRTPGLKLAGPAVTVQCLVGSIITVHQALAAAEPGSVLVVDGLGDHVSALFGELMGRDARAARLAGIIVDGAIRDVAGLGELGFPTFSRWVTPRVGTNRRLGRINVPISCGGIPVTPGDWVVGDDDGVVVVPRLELNSVSASGLAIEDKEVDIARQIDAGKRIADILGMRTQWE
jgi:4-hydroxy-4-methyl-2-oxoglutarate aldolase